MLMDLFHSTLPSQFGPNRYGSTRIHFHSFMMEVLQRQHAVTKKYADLGMAKNDALPEVARSLAAEGRVLCFDEFQVSRGICRGRSYVVWTADDRSRTLSLLCCCGSCSSD